MGDNGGNAYIKQNENILCAGWFNDNNGETATCTAVVELTEADSVRVTGNIDNPADLRGAYSSGFAGKFHLHNCNTYKFIRVFPILYYIS